MLALEGIKIIDLSRAVPGAMCTMVLGDLGAEIIKVETPPQLGDRARGALKTPVGEEQRKYAAYEAFGRNKKSLVLNLKSEEGKTIFYRLAKTADVVVEGFRPGVTRRLGIDFDRIRALNNRIVYCSLSGYGQDGPYANLPGHDINYISAGGALSLIGEAEANPVIPLNLVADLAGGALHGVTGILAALMNRNKTGIGQYVDIAYTDTVVYLLLPFLREYFRSGKVMKRGETALHGAYPYYAIYETKDNKYVSLGCLEPWLWENFCRAIGREDFTPYHCLSEHYQNKPTGDIWGTISATLKDIFRSKTRDEWFVFLSGKNVPVAKVYTPDEVFTDPQIKHRQMVIEIDSGEVGKIRQIGIPFKLSETPCKVRSLPALLGENTNETLLDLGYSKEELKTFRESGIIG